MRAQAALQNLSDDELVILAQAGGRLGTAAETVLTERHDDLIRKAVSKLPHPPTNAEDAADAYQGGRHGFILAVRRFLPGKAKLTTYAWSSVRGGALRALKETYDKLEPLSLEALMAEVAEQDEFAVEDGDPAQDGWGSGEVADLVGRLQAKQREVLVRRFIDDETQATIASALGVSESAVSQQLKTIFRTARATLTPNAA